jgi:cytochrome bd-type quinol oxidase subunit 2
MVATDAAVYSSTPRSEGMRIALIAALVALLIANITATAVVLRSHTATLRQKALQTSLVWLIPLLGAVVVVTFHWLDRRKPGPQSDSSGLDVSDINIGAAGQERHDP